MGFFLDPTTGKAGWNNSSAGGGGAVDSVNGQTGVVVLDTDDIAEGTTNLYSQWETLSPLTLDWLQPKGDERLFIGDSAIISEVETEFNNSAALFTNIDNSGTSYFGNLGIGSGLVSFGGLFLSLRAQGTASSPTVCGFTDLVGGMAFGAYDGSSFSINMNGTQVLPGFFLILNSAPDGVTGNFDSNIYMGGVISSFIEAQLRNTGQSAVIINSPNNDVDFQVNWESGTAFAVNGANGVTTFSVDPLVPDEAYGSGWNGSTEVPTKNAIYDKIEAVNKKSVTIQVTDGTSNVVTGDGKAYFTIPEILNGFNLSRAQATVVTAGTTNATTVMIHNKTQAADMLSGAISIASGGTVGTVGTIDSSNDDVATNDIIRIDVDSVSTTAPQGLMVVLEFTLP